MRRKVVVALVATLALAAIPAAASTFVHMSPKELIAEADTVVQGRVVQLDSFWTESGRLIATEAMVEVEETLLGAAPGTVAVRTFGGQVGDVKVEAPGFPRFEQGERVLLFLERSPDDGTVRVLGYQQGHFRVVTRKDGVTLAVPMVDDDARFLTRDGKLGPAPRSLEIGYFKQQVEKVAASVGRLRNAR